MPDESRDPLGKKARWVAGYEIAPGAEAHGGERHSACVRRSIWRNLTGLANQTTLISKGLRRVITGRVWSCTAARFRPCPNEIARATDANRTRGRGGTS
jgi:hypothetical protein